MVLLLSLLYQLTKKLNKMKQSINLKSIWFNIKRALYAMMVIVITLAIPALAYLELSHTDKQENSKEVVKENSLARQTKVHFQNQS